MMFDDFTTQSASVDMGINLGRTDTFMSQHALNGTEIGASFQQVGGERMAEGMGADVLGEPYGFAQYFDDVENHDSGDVLSTFTDEYIIFIPRLDVHCIAVHEV